MSQECGTLFERTQELLRNTNKTYLEIYEETQLSPHWLSLFRNGKWHDPSVNKIQRLYECLTGRELNV